MVRSDTKFIKICRNWGHDGDDKQNYNFFLTKQRSRHHNLLKENYGKPKK